MSRYNYNAEIGQTDLMGAAYNGDAEEIETILTMPCDIDARDAHGMTALMYAAMRGYHSAVSVLLEGGADKEIESAQRWTALMYAVRGNHEEAVRLLLRAKADPNVHGDYDTLDTPLTLAAWQGYFPIVRALVAAGADVSLHGGIMQITAEAVARRAGFHEISEYLCYHEKRP